jgi:hypothetical protein
VKITSSPICSNRLHNIIKFITFNYVKRKIKKVHKKEEKNIIRLNKIKINVYIKFSLQALTCSCNILIHFHACRATRPVSESFLLHNIYGQTHTSPCSWICPMYMNAPSHMSLIYFFI